MEFPQISFPLIPCPPPRLPHGGISAAWESHRMWCPGKINGEWNPQALMLSHGLFWSRLEGYPGEIPRLAFGKRFLFAFLTELVLVNRVSQTGRGNLLPIKTSRLRRDRKEAVWVFGATCFGSGWSISPFYVDLINTLESNWEGTCRLLELHHWCLLGVLPLCRTPPRFALHITGGIWSPFWCLGFIYYFISSSLLWLLFQGLRTTRLRWAGWEGLFPSCRWENSV